MSNVYCQYQIEYIELHLRHVYNMFIVMTATITMIRKMLRIMRYAEDGEDDLGGYNRDMVGLHHPVVGKP